MGKATSKLLLKGVNEHVFGQGNVHALRLAPIFGFLEDLRIESHAPKRRSMSCFLRKKGRPPA